MLDQEKAFDSVSWDTTRRVFKAMGFGPNICRWVSILCNSDTPLTRQLRINGELSEPFHIRSGVPQGDVFSPICFACIMEPLARMIQSPSSGITGITVGGIRYIISLYADDTVIFLTEGMRVD